MIQVEIRTLTPLWTGGIETNRMDRIHETGIMGSLRWWYEVILRGLGARVCNPTGPSEGRCNFDVEHPVCKSCQLFGATGWGRRFRMTLNGGEYLFPPAEPRINVRAPNGRRGWYFGAPLISSVRNPILGQIIPLRGPSVADDLAIVTSVISRWGGLGAKTQHGWGVVQTQLRTEDGEPLPLDLDAFLHRFPGDSTHDTGLPSLSNVFFAKLYLRDGVADDWWAIANLGHGIRDQAAKWRLRNAWTQDQPFSVPIAPAVKYKLRFGGTPAPRPYLEQIAAGNQERFFFGHVGQPNRAAMLHISNAYKQNNRWQFRLWGWLPEEGNEYGLNRSTLVPQIHRLATSNTAFWDSVLGRDIVDLSQTEWCEMDRIGHRRNRPAPTITPATSGDFLRHLLS